MPNNPATPDAFFLIEKDMKNAQLVILFANKTIANAFGQIDFYSKLLHSLKPDATGIWVETNKPRIDAYIKGWPKWANWKRTGDKTFSTGLSISDSSKIQELEKQLVQAMPGLIGKKDSQESLMRATYVFEIVTPTRTFMYRFLGRAREICALCILFDEIPHPRNHLEVITKIIPLNDFPVKSIPTQPERIYGDPSKTVDELRNQGFPRVSDFQGEAGMKPSILINRKDFAGSQQEHYQLVIREQNFEAQVGRSQIPEGIKLALYEANNYKCSICHNTYTKDYLAPDHRVPAIVKADDLTKSNFLQKLQTLCRTCNQVKREVCKKCPFEKQCINCSWAFPEKHSIGPNTLNKITVLAKNKGMTSDEFLNFLIKNNQISH